MNTEFFQGAATFCGRLLLSAIFLSSGAHKLTAWEQTASRMQEEGMVAVHFFLTAAVLFELGGGLSVLLGFRARMGALVLILFLIPTTLVFHDFWTYEEEERQMQMIQFMKNLAILGGLLVLCAFGAGPWSFDGRRNLFRHSR